MTVSDWLVIGGGITGAALAYELARQQFTVTLLDPDTPEHTATDCSYGGLAHWAGTTPLLRQLCQEGLARHRDLTAEFDQPTEFRETHLLLTIKSGVEPTKILTQYQQRFTVNPSLLTPQDAHALEPLINPEAIAAALRLPHAHIHPSKTAHAYRQAFLRLGGKIMRDRATHWQVQNEQIMGVHTPTQTLTAGQTVLCAGGWTRSLLAQLNLTPPIYFTHAEILETDAPPGTVKGVIMPAQLQRFALEKESTSEPSRWQKSGLELAPPILDLGLVQFADGMVRLGQISRTLSDPDVEVDAIASRAKLQQAAQNVFPQLDLSRSQWRHCLVSFSPEPLPPIGPIADWSGLHVFNGFGNPLVLTPALAHHFAIWAAGGDDPVLATIISK